MGEVYAAVDMRVAADAADREVALKLITLDRARAHAAAPGFKRLVERFNREMDILGRLDHPGVPRLIASGYDDERHQPYLAMRLIDGVTLRAHIDNDLVDDDHVQTGYLYIANAPFGEAVPEDRRS